MKQGGLTKVFQQIVANLQAGLVVKGVVGSAFGPLLQSVKNKMVFIVKDELFSGLFSSVDFNNYSRVLFLPPRTCFEGAPSGFNSELLVQYNRSASLLSSGLSGENVVLCAESTLSSLSIEKNGLFLDVDRTVEYDFLMDLLVDFNYSVVDIVSSPGEFATRGAIIDVFPVNSVFPVRVGFFEDTAEIFVFSLSSQLTTRKLEKIQVVPVVVEQEGGSGLKDVLSEGWSWFFWDVTELYPINIQPSGSVHYGFRDFYYYERADIGLGRVEEVSSLLTVKGLVLNEKVYCPAWFFDQNASNNEAAEAQQKSVFDASVGDYLVHEDFGVCEYRGMLTHDSSESVVLLFDGGGRVNVDTSCLYKVGFFALKHQSVELDSLDKGGVWRRRKNSVLKKAESVVDGLVRFYAERGLVFRAPYDGGLMFEKDLIDSFQFQDTKDQVVCWKEIKKDLLGDKPMDRLLCGDVGFGKTELAIRTAFFVALSGGAVVVLSPTTILATQLYSAFLERLSSFGIKVGIVTRFKSSYECDKVVLGFVEKKINILIGTHKLLYDESCLLQADLLIVDEEHRFGVSQKEKVASLKSSVDILSMSATPIPRTLQLSVAGIRDMSLLNTPPKSRLPIKTHVFYYSKRVVVEAVSNELSRNGQVFFVHNNVGSIESVVRSLSEWFPGVVVDFVHGQERAKRVEQKMIDFVAGNIKILVCTSIIESGIDISNANTILINNAHLFGLSQLYQIRGRVGRSSEQGFAYMLVPKGCSLGSDAYNRLKTIENNTSLGSGYAVAMRDMEIRGVGSLLGHSQSGGEVVGPELYTRFLALALRRVNEGGEVRVFDPRSVLVQIYKECFIPENYISVQRLRLGFYKQLSSFLEKDELVECYENIINRFGPAPKEFEKYVSSLLVRFSAFHAFVSKVNYSNDMLLITFSLVNGGSLVGLLLDFVSESFEACGLNYFFKNTKDGGLLLSFRYTKDKDIATFLIGFFDKLSLVLGRNN